MVQGVMAEPEYAYSIGLYPTLGYELILSGMSMAVASHYINVFAQDLIAGKKLPLRTPIDEYTTRPFALMWADPQKYTGLIGLSVRHFEGEVVPYQQIVKCDKEDRFPWDPGYDESTVVKQDHLYIQYTC